MLFTRRLYNKEILGKMIITFTLSVPSLLCFFPSFALVAPFHDFQFLGDALNWNCETYFLSQSWGLFHNFCHCGKHIFYVARLWEVLKMKVQTLTKLSNNSKASWVVVLNWILLLHLPAFSSHSFFSSNKTIHNNKNHLNERVQQNHDLLKYQTIMHSKQTRKWKNGTRKKTYKNSNLARNWNIWTVRIIIESLFSSVVCKRLKLD